MPPQRSVVLDAELCEHARAEPIRVMLASPGKLDDLATSSVTQSPEPTESWSRAHTA
jgi:hypothetical protein